MSATPSPAPTKPRISWRRIRLIAMRELRERLAQRVYRLVAIVGAVLVAAAVVVPTLIGGGDDGPETTTVPVAFPGLPAAEASSRASALEDSARSLGVVRVRVRIVSEAQAERLVRDGDEDLAVVVRGPARQPRGKFLIRENSGADAQPSIAALQRAAIEARVAVIAPADQAEVLAPVSVQAQTVRSTGPTPAGAAVLGVMTLVLYLVGLLQITAFANGLVTDRAGRIVERLLTAARPEEHLAGKLLGVGAAGLLQMLAWAVGAIVGAVAVSGGLGDTFQGVPAGLLIWFPISVVLTYVLYAALTAVLVLPVRKIEDVAGALALGSMLQIVAYIAATTIIAPGSTVNGTIHAMSLVPFFSPLLMLARLAGGDVPGWELAVGILGPLLTAALLIRLVAPAYARHAIDAPGGKGLGAAIKALRS